MPNLIGNWSLVLILSDSFTCGVQGECETPPEAASISSLYPEILHMKPKRCLNVTRMRLLECWVASDLTTWAEIVTVGYSNSVSVQPR